MDTQSIGAILSLAFGLGLLHALDADHIMAVSGLASSRPTLAGSLNFCLRWAIGHGSALLVIGAMIFVLGVALPENFSHIAEQLVGIMLIGLGIWLLFTIARGHMVISFHKHPGLPQHTHWQSKDRKHTHDIKSGPLKVEHGAVMVGMLHGIAGSAPLLALVPLIHTQSFLFGITYLLIFGGGVLCSMLLFGGLLGGCYQFVQAWSSRALSVLRMSMGLGAIGYGSFLLITTGSS